MVTIREAEEMFKSQWSLPQSQVEQVIGKTDVVSRSVLHPAKEETRSEGRHA
jgi:hypothetical protein